MGTWVGWDHGSPSKRERVSECVCVCVLCVC